MTLLVILSLTFVNFIGSQNSELKPNLSLGGVAFGATSRAQNGISTMQDRRQPITQIKRSRTSARITAKAYMEFASTIPVWIADTNVDEQQELLFKCAETVSKNADSKETAVINVSAGIKYTYKRAREARYSHEIAVEKTVRLFNLPYSQMYAGIELPFFYQVMKPKHNAR